MAAKPVQVDITESPEFIAQLLEKEKNMKRYQKLRTLYLLKTGKVPALKHISQIIGRDLETVRRWIKRYRQGGLLKLLEDGNDRFLDTPEWVINRLVEEFQDTQFLPSIQAIQDWVTQELGVQISYDKLQILIRFKLLPAQQVRRANQNSRLEKIPIDISDLKDLSGVYSQFSGWRDERGFPNDSQALNQILGELFGIRPVHAVSPFQQPGKTLIESISQAPLTAEIPYNIPDLLSLSRLAERLRVHPTTLYYQRRKRIFPGWTKLRDPDSVGWLWVPEFRKFRAILSYKEIEAILLSPNDKPLCR